MKQGPHYLRFGIDGLEDTNHLYRRGADWKTVMRSAAAFIDAGGRAEWDFLDAGELETSDRYEVLDRKGNFEYYLEQPQNSAYVNPAFGKLEVVKREYGEYETYLDQVGIDCKVAGAKRKIYLSAQGYALPCCWLGAVFSESSTPERRQFADLLAAYGGSDAVDARRQGLKAVVEGPLFQQAIPGSWEQASIADGKLAICARTCGEDYDPLDHQRD